MRTYQNFIWHNYIKFEVNRVIKKQWDGNKERLRSKYLIGEKARQQNFIPKVGYSRQTPVATVGQRFTVTPVTYMCITPRGWHGSDLQHSSWKLHPFHCISYKIREWVLMTISNPWCWKLSHIAMCVGLVTGANKMRQQTFSHFIISPSHKLKYMIQSRKCKTSMHHWVIYFHELVFNSSMQIWRTSICATEF